MLNSPSRILCFLALLTLTGAAARAAESPQPVDLLALGGDNYYWIGEVTKQTQPKPSVFTRISARQYGSGEKWRMYTTVSAPVKSLAQRGDQLAAMLSNGEWILVWPTGQSQGARLPAGRLLALAGESDTLWAVALVPGGAKAIPTQPTTHPTTRSATTRGASTGPEKLVLLRLDRSQWLSVAELPENLQVPAEGVEISMICLNHAPMVAVRDGDQAVRIARFTRQQVWLDMARVASPAPIKQFALVAGPTHALLWVADESGPGSITAVEPAAVALKPLDSSRAIPPGAPRAVTSAGERLRLLFNDGTQVYEQQFNVDGNRVGEAEIMQVPVAVVTSPIMNYISTAVMAALMFTIVSAIRQRPAIQETLEAAAELPLATFGLRLGAGIVDALPVIITMLIVIKRSGSVDAVRQLDGRIFTPVIVAAIVYLAHVTIMELITARSIGKMLFGLRVVDLQGQRPGAKAILIRNLLRVVDLWLMGVPLVLVLYSPLRQRAGDVAAGTLILRDQKPTDKPA